MHTQDTTQHTRTCIAHARLGLERVRCAPSRLSRSPGSEILQAALARPLASPCGGTLEHRPGTGPWCGSGVSARWPLETRPDLRWRLALDPRSFSPHLLGERFSQLQGFLLFYIISAYSEGKRTASSLRALKIPPISLNTHTPQFREHSDLFIRCLTDIRLPLLCLCLPL